MNKEKILSPVNSQHANFFLFFIQQFIYQQKIQFTHLITRNNQIITRWCFSSLWNYIIAPDPRAPMDILIMRKPSPEVRHILLCLYGFFFFFSFLQPGQTRKVCIKEPNYSFSLCLYTAVEPNCSYHKLILTHMFPLFKHRLQILNASFKKERKASVKELIRRIENHYNHTNELASKFMVKKL